MCGPPFRWDTSPSLLRLGHAVHGWRDNPVAGVRGTNARVATRSARLTAVAVAGPTLKTVTRVGGGMNASRQVVVLSGVRAPVGSHGGNLKDIPWPGWGPWSSRRRSAGPAYPSSSNASEAADWRR